LHLTQARIILRCFAFFLSGLPSGLPTPTKHHPDERGVVGKPFTLVCHNSLAGQRVSWWRRISPDAETEFIDLGDGLVNGFVDRCRLDGDDLVFLKLELNDTGIYTCVEEAGQGVRHVTQLNVSGNQRRSLRE